MAAELVNTATSDKLPEMDWMKNIEICELVANDHRQARDVIKAIKKRLGSKSGNSQLLAVMLLEMLMNNIGEPVHKQVVDTGLLPTLVKIVKKKSNLPVREKIFLLLDAAQTSVGGASGRFPQYYSAYYELVSAGVQFSQRPIADQRNEPVSHATTGNPAVVPVTVAPPSEKKSTAKVEPQKIPDSSILQKAGAALEVLREVVDAVDTRHPEGAKDEFTLDLVEQCSFQKQRVMHLAMTSRDDVLVAQAIEMNDQLERLLRRHDALISGRPTSTSNHISLEEPEEEEEAEQLFRRMRKGKACLQPEDESPQMNGSLGLLGSSGRAGMLHRPLIRPLTIEPKHDSSPPLIRPLTIEPKHDSSPPLIRPLTIKPKHDSSPPLIRPLTIEPKHDSSSLLIRPLTVEPKNDSGGDKPAVSIPPPPAKHVEREKFFQDHHGSGLATHVRGLSLHSRNASTSSRSTDLSDDNLL